MLMEICLNIKRQCKRIESQRDPLRHSWWQKEYDDKKFSRTKLLMTSLVFAFLSLCCTEDFVDASLSFLPFFDQTFMIYLRLYASFFCLEIFLVSRCFSFVVQALSLYLSFQLIYFLLLYLQVTFYFAFFPLCSVSQHKIIVGRWLNLLFFTLFYLYSFAMVLCHFEYWKHCYAKHIDLGPWFQSNCRIYCNAQNNLMDMLRLRNDLIILWPGVNNCQFLWNHKSLMHCQNR